MPTVVSRQMGPSWLAAIGVGALGGLLLLGR